MFMLRAPVSSRTGNFTPVNIKQNERAFVFHLLLETFYGETCGRWGTYGAESFVTLSVSPCPSVPSSFGVKAPGRDFFWTVFCSTEL